MQVSSDDERFYGATTTVEYSNRSDVKGPNEWRCGSNANPASKGGSKLRNMGIWGLSNDIEVGAQVQPNILNYKI